MGRTAACVSSKVKASEMGNELTAADVQEGTELERIEQWRMEELERAGYSVEAAGKLARRHDVDLHDAVEMIARGCPPELALRILL